MFIQFIFYAAVGAIGTLAHFIILTFLVEILSVNIVFASTSGFIVGAFINYFLNYKYVFKSDAQHKISMSKFMLVAFFGMLANAGIMNFLVVTMILYYLLAQIISTIAVLLMNYTINYLWTFKNE